MDYRANVDHTFDVVASVEAKEVLITELEESSLAMVGGGTGETIVG